MTKQQRFADLMAEASAAEAAGDLPRRNAAATKILSQGREFNAANGSRVETWWDRISRNWITQIWDETGWEIESTYSGEKVSAAVAHFWAVRQIWQGAK